MRLIVVGCSGSMSGPTSPASCYLVQVEGSGPDGAQRTYTIALDMGPGAFGAMLNYVDVADLDAVVVSHLHADHVVDLAGLEVYRRFHPDGALGPVPLFGPQGTRKRVAELAMTNTSEELEDTFSFISIAHGHPIEVGPLRIEPIAVHHPVETYGLRISGPSSESGGGQALLAYSADTDTCDNLIQLAADVHLLLCEAAFQEGRDGVRGIHLTGRRAGQAAHEAAAKHLVLTHLPPWNDPAAVTAEAGEVYSGPIAMAAPGNVYTV